MSRLTEHDVESLAVRLKEHDKVLRAACGSGLSGIARNAAGKDYGPQGVRVGVVPVTTGLGVIGGFCEAVAGILRYLGADTYISPHADVKGIWDVVQNQCDIVFGADDDTFIAVNLPGKQTSDNSEATGRGFAAALDMAAGGIRGREALVLGGGPVGRSAAAVLYSRGARVGLYDIDPARAREARSELPFLELRDDLDEALKAAPFVLDATPAEGFLTHRQLRDDTVISAPGVPLGVAEESLPALAGKLIHDVLEIGVATMLYDVL